ncbi:hypothetical protein [Nocardioides kongjuensis]|uniref:hypothetical protein n=1 Tax=Nocardioides kongjuensis TaxID=349522 RepID=UPI0031F19FC0
MDIAADPSRQVGKRAGAAAPYDGSRNPKSPRDLSGEVHDLADPEPQHPSVAAVIMLGNKLATSVPCRNGASTFVERRLELRGIGAEWHIHTYEPVADLSALAGRARSQGDGQCGWVGGVDLAGRVTWRKW